MTPTTEKVHTPTVPSFIDDDFIKTLSKMKQEYWANRKEGKRGQGDNTIAPKFVRSPQNVTMGFDAQGNMYAKTRAIRRHKPATDNQYTKKQNKRKK